MTQGVIKSVQPAGSWNTNDGNVLFKYEYEMEDGTTLTAFHQKQEPVGDVGDECEYELRKNTQRGWTGKVRKPGSAPNYSASRSNGSGRNQEQIQRQWAINAAIEFLTSTAGDPSQLTSRWVCGQAKEFFEMSLDFDAYLEKTKPGDKPNKAGDDGLPF